MATARKKKIGRPRDERVRRCVLDTVRGLLRTGSLCGLTMEGVARQAGVGKVTIYRWWPSVAAVTLEVLLEDAGEACPMQDTGDVAADLKTFLRNIIATIQTRTGTLLRCLMIEAQKNPAFREEFRERFILARQEALAGLLRRNKAGAKERNIIIDMIFGTMWYRLLVGHAPLDDALADDLCKAAMTLMCKSKKDGT
jgi:AcrR family transcriptional regulator